MLLFRSLYLVYLRLGSHVWFQRVFLAFSFINNCMTSLLYLWLCACLWPLIRSVYGDLSCRFLICHLWLKVLSVFPHPGITRGTIIWNIWSYSVYSVSRRRVIYWKGSVIRFVLRPEGTLDHSTMRRIATKTTVTHPCGSYFALVIIVSFLPCSLSAVRRLWLISIFSSSVIWLQSLSRVFTPSLRNCSSFLLSL